MATSIKRWLKGQLTKTKAKEQPWSDLAQSLAELLEMHVESYLTRLKNRSSLYDLTKEDLLEDTKELRKIFPLGNVKDEDLAHVIMQRKDEIHFKKTVYPLLSTLTREFQGMEVEWVRLFAPIDQERYPYGSLYAQEDELDDFHDLTRDDFFLTSRGVIRIPINMIQSGFSGIGENEIREFEERVRQVVYPLIPLTIVCDGQVYYIKINLLELIEWTEYKDAITMPLQPIEQTECAAYSQQDSNKTIVTTTENKQATVIRARARFGAVPIGAIALDSV